ncbi:hypothetical protein IY145_21200 [Methylosinus sp. H3A]|uniref:hypothetical protein n=1 Tax=Methylosinus sp. H3A TaxID=2785786 RepID=UPI0018C2E183|nr:hypothetical protein [Methylosinus sp. H3A]MBG0811869.1 hypothetical protein [Methylosinus sp. H3A]
MATKKIAPTIGAKWVSVTDIKLALTRARENRERQTRLLDNLSAKVAQRQRDVERTLADLHPSQQALIVGRAVSTFRTQIKRESADERLARVREAGRLAHEVAGARQHYASAVQMLIREGLGSERRSRLMQQIEHSGPTELASLAALAASTGDREMGAALVSRVNRMDAGDRPFSSQALAAVLVGAEFRDVTAALMEIERTAEEAAHADTAFERGHANLVRAIKSALDRRAQEAVGADLDAFVIGRNTNTSSAQYVSRHQRSRQRRQEGEQRWTHGRDRAFRVAGERDLNRVEWARCESFHWEIQLCQWQDPKCRQTPVARRIPTQLQFLHAH